MSTEPDGCLVRKKFATAEADITYIATAKGCVYLTYIPDVYSRRIGRWAMESRLTAGCDDGCTGIVETMRVYPLELTKKIVESVKKGVPKSETPPTSG